MLNKCVKRVSSYFFVIYSVIWQCPAAFSHLSFLIASFNFSLVIYILVCFSSIIPQKRQYFSFVTSCLSFVFVANSPWKYSIHLFRFQTAPLTLPIFIFICPRFGFLPYFLKRRWIMRINNYNPRLSHTSHPWFLQ